MSAHKKAPSVRAQGALGNEISLEKDHMKNINTVVDMRKFVESRDGKAFTTSQQVADAFGKQHHHVMQKLDALDCSDQFLTSNFSRVKFEHRGNTYDACEMSKDGFMFLVMGFTGSKAAAIKEGYIDAFNWMAGQLGINSTDLVHTVIGNTGELVLDRVIEQKGYKVPQTMKRSFKHTMKSRLRARFNVQKTALIPADQMADACNFVAAFALEGEWLGKERAQGDVVFSRLDLAMLYTFSSAAMQLCDMSEKFKPVLEAMRSMTLFGAEHRLETCRLVVGHFHEKIGTEMELAARKEELFDEWMDLRSAKDRNRSIINLGEDAA